MDCWSHIASCVPTTHFSWVSASWSQTFFLHDRGPSLDPQNASKRYNIYIYIYKYVYYMYLRARILRLKKNAYLEHILSAGPGKNSFSVNWLRHPPNSKKTVNTWEQWYIIWETMDTSCACMQEYNYFQEESLYGVTATLWEGDGSPLFSVGWASSTFVSSNFDTSK